MERPLEMPRKVEKEKSLETGANVLVVIELLRHPEKDYQTGKLTPEGKEDFAAKLAEKFSVSEYDVIKFFVSPLERGIETKQVIEDFLKNNGSYGRVGHKQELGGESKAVGQNFETEMSKILESRGIMSGRERVVGEGSENIFTEENFERETNQLLLREYFDKNFPDSDFTGRDMSMATKKLVDHFSRLASNLKSESKGKIILVGHSGIIEYFTKYVYLQNHPEAKPEDVDAGKIGGLLDFGEGPEITIRSDEAGKQTILFSFKGLNLTYRHE